MMSAMLSITALAVVTATSVQPFHILGEGDRWFITDDTGTVVERLSSFGGLRPVHAAIAADGSEIAFTSHVASVENNLLFIWDRGPGHARLLGREVGTRSTSTVARPHADGRS